MNPENEQPIVIDQENNQKKRTSPEKDIPLKNAQESDCQKSLDYVKENSSQSSLDDNARIGSDKAKVFIANVKQHTFYKFISSSKTKLASYVTNMPQLNKKIVFSRTLSNLKSVLDNKEKLNSSVNDSSRLRINEDDDIFLEVKRFNFLTNLNMALIFFYIKG